MVTPALDPQTPPNLHISLTSRASLGPRLSERVEQKFFILPEHVGTALALLSSTCRRDPAYPVGQVNSLYFDTFDLEEHRRSDAGDSDKDKIRIRWYGEKFDPHVRRGCVRRALAADEAVQVWLERKTRRGFAATKQREALQVPASALAFEALGRGIVPPATLVDTMARFGFFSRGRLCPIVAISYWRYRFVEPCTGFRISIDSRIRSSLLLPGLGRGERGLELLGAVVEVKGKVFDLPYALRPLAEVGASWTRYSKYSSSLDAHTAGLGSVSRNWPSGMMEREPGRIASVQAKQIG
jgi:hypothetical protein